MLRTSHVRRRRLRLLRRAGARNPRPPTEEVAMNKLSLKVEELSVESFAVSAGDGEAGTVQAYHHSRGHHATCDPLVGTCFGYTCFETCAGTCGDTCASCVYTCDPAVGTCFGYTCYATCPLPA